MRNNCSVMVLLASSRELKLAMGYNLIIAALGTPLFVWGSLKLWTGMFMRTFHINLRLIMQMYLIGLILHCYGRVTLHALDLYNYTVLDPCEMIPNIYRCFVFRFFYNSGIWITIYTTIPLIIERLIATILKDRYENRFLWIGVLLMFLPVCLAAFPLYLAYSNLAFDGVFMPYCSVYKPGHPEIANLNSEIALVSQVVARIMFGYLFYHNKKLRAKMQRSSLSMRFQLEQNKISMQCLKIYADISTIFLFAQMGSFTYLMKIAPGMPWERYLAWMEMNYQFPLYGIITVLLVAKRITSVRNQINTALTSQFTANAQEVFFVRFNKQIGVKVPRQADPNLIFVKRYF